MGEAFRANAKAEGQCVVIGGWECINGTPPSRARWFSVALNRRSAPWAFARGEPFRTIAALELYASLVCYVMFSPRWLKATKGTVRLSGITDNLGNSFVISRLMTSKFPSLVILTEFAAQLRRNSMELELGWVPRDQNQEADRLTNECFNDFDPKMRMHFNPVEAKWLVMTDMLQASEHIYATLKDKKVGARVMAPKRRPGERLRVRDPW